MSFSKVRRSIRLQALVQRAMVAIVVCAGASGCRTSTVGFGFALVGDGITEIDARHRQKSFKSKPIEAAYTDLGDELDTFTDTLTGNRYVCFPTPSVPRTQSFYLIRISETEQILDVQHWIEWHDGFEDSFKLAIIEPKIVGKTISEAGKNARLEPPLFVFTREKAPGTLYVYNATNWTHLRPRLLGITVGDDGLCTKVSYYGVAGGQGLRTHARNAVQAGGDEAQHRGNAAQLAD